MWVHAMASFWPYVSRAGRPCMRHHLQSLRRSGERLLPFGITGVQLSTPGTLVRRSSMVPRGSRDAFNCAPIMPTSVWDSQTAANDYSNLDRGSFQTDFLQLNNFRDYASKQTQLSVFMQNSYAPEGPRNRKLTFILDWASLYVSSALEKKHLAMQLRLL